MQKLIVILVVAVLSCSSAMACSCSWSGRFLTNAQKNKFVIEAVVLKYGPKLRHGKNLYESMEIEITSLIKGKTDSKKITVLGDPGNLCRVYISSERFPVGGKFMFVFNDDKKAEVPLSVCGEFYVKVDKTNVKGFDRDKGVKYTKPLKDFVAQIK